MNKRTAAVADRILVGWPARLDQMDIDELSRLAVETGGDRDNAEQFNQLVEKMMEALPTPLLGAAEATRLGRLVALLDALRITIDRAAVASMRERYEQAERLPTTVRWMLDELERFTPVQSTFPDAVEWASPDGDGDGAMPAAKSPSYGGGARRSYPSTAPKPTRPWWKDWGVFRLRRNSVLAEDWPQTQPAAPGATRPDEEATEPTPAEQQRFFRAEIQDHDGSQSLSSGEQYTIALDVGLAATGWAGPLPAGLFIGHEDAMLELTVQLTSRDFKILSDGQRPLRLPRSGPSNGKARFEITPRRTGQCQLTATLHHHGNFLTQLRLGIPVGQPGTYTVETIGRPVDDAVVLEPRDIALVIRPEGAGYTCIAMGSAYFEAPLPLTADALAAAAGAARKELTDVVTGVYGGKQPFLDAIDIPDDIQQEALKRLARAGKRLFQKLFQSPAAGADVRSIGEWLLTFATDPGIQLTLQVVAAQVPIPWSMLYLGEVRDGAELSWDNFLGFRHIIEQLPFQSLPGSTSRFIESQPDLSVSVNINPTIDSAMQIDLVRAHQQHWTEIGSSRKKLALVERSTRAEIMSALADKTNGDKVWYFYCHATSSSVDPDQSAIIMGKPADRIDYATLRDLNLDAPTDIKLAGRPLVFLNACDSADLSPRFYDGLVPYFLAKGGRGVIGTECKTPVLFAIYWAEAFVDQLLAGVEVGQTMLTLRRKFLREHGNPLGLLYTVYCDANTQVAPPLVPAP